MWCRVYQRLPALLCAGIVLLVAAMPISHAQVDVSREARIQAVLILRLIKFVTWPTDNSARADVLQICTWGDSPTDLALQNLQGQKIREQEIKVRKLSAPLNTRGCHVLYVSENARDINSTLLYESGNRSLLTISDMPDFHKRGGIINLIQQGNRMGFEIQLRYAREHGLLIGAPLLELAHVVE